MTDVERWLAAAAASGLTAGGLLIVWWASAHEVPRRLAQWLRRRDR